jgi:hypothetical protein
VVKQEALFFYGVDSYLISEISTDISHDFPHSFQINAGVIPELADPSGCAV